jgi:hypothetical protein
LGGKTKGAICNLILLSFYFFPPVGGFWVVVRSPPTSHDLLHCGGSGLCWLVLGSVVFGFVQSGLGVVAGGAPGGWWIVVGINGWWLTGSLWAWLFLLLNFLFLFE